MAAVAPKTPKFNGEGPQGSGELPEACEREAGGHGSARDHDLEGDEGGRVADAGSSGDVREALDSIPAQPAPPRPAPRSAVGQAGEAAEQLAAAVTAALRPDCAPLDYAPYRQGVGAAVQRLRSALLALIRELEPRTSTEIPDSAVARAHLLAADIRFVRPLELGQ